MKIPYDPHIQRNWVLFRFTYYNHKLILQIHIHLMVDEIEKGWNTTWRKWRSCASGCPWSCGENKIGEASSRIHRIHHKELRHHWVEMFLVEWKKIGKFRTRRFQQVKIFSLQILCLIVFINPKPFEKKEKNVFIYCWCLFDGFYFSILLLININSLPFSETSRRSSRSISNGNNSIGHGSCRSGCCSRRRRIKQKIPAEVGVMPCEIPVKRSGKVLLPRFSLQEY